MGNTRACPADARKSEIHRHRLRKPVWARLLSPLKRAQRIQGVLPAAEELPDHQMLPRHPLWILVGGGLDYCEIARQATKRPHHINILETKALVRVEKEISHESFNRRAFVLGDSQVALGVWVKGRGSSIALNEILQDSLPVHLGCNVITSAGFLPTEFNTADGPSQNRSCGSKLLDWPEGLFESLEAGRLDQLDAWLGSYGADPYSLSGLPALEELRREADLTGRRARTQLSSLSVQEVRVGSQAGRRTQVGVEQEPLKARKNQEASEPNQEAKEPTGRVAQSFRIVQDLGAPSCLQKKSRTRPKRIKRPPSPIKRPESPVKRPTSPTLV